MKMTKEFLSRQKYNAKYLLAAGSVGLASATPMVAFANNGGSANQTLETTIGTIAKWILNIFMYIGILLLIWAIGQLILAFKNEDADSKSRAMMIMVVSVILIFLGTIVKAVLKAAGQDAIANAL